MRKILIVLIMFACVMNVMAQTDRQQIRSGNRQYRVQKYDKAETDYRKAVSANAKNPQALYNLGCALMQQQKDSAAIEQFQKAGKLETSKLRKAKVYHNIGVICQGHQMFSEAIEAYKESLRNNPHDDETRYNLALCQRQLKKQNKNQNQQNQDQNKDQNGNDKKQEQDQNKDNKDKQQDKNQQQPPKEQMSKDNAEQMLQAAMQEEKATQQRMKDAMRQQSNRHLQKNW